MDFEITERRNDITYDVPKVFFPAYEEYMAKATQVADYVRNTEVSPETVKEAKKILADARRLTDRLTQLRIDMKKEILENYTVVESQIKEIVSVVDGADREVREKVRELDQVERDRRKQQLYDIWMARTTFYDDVRIHFPNAFELWLKPQYLNKSASLPKIEKEMADWLEAKSKDISTAESMGKEYLVEYVKHGNLADAVEAVKQSEKIKENLSAYEDPTEEKAVFEVTGTKDIKLTEMILNDNEINYIRR